MSIGVLGGGLVGLVIGSHLKLPHEILEADTRTGGHCRSLISDGYTFDFGGPHIMFSRDEKTLAYMVELLGDNVVEQRRNVKVLYNGTFVKYPFENGIFALSPQERYECLSGFVCNDYKGGNTFKDWIYRTFGKGLAEKYLIPYNEKIWNVSTEEMSDDWVEGRVPKPPAEDIIKSAVGVETEGYTHQLYFKYPKQGGIEALARAFEKDCPSITHNFRVEKVWRENGQWHISNGKETRCYEQIISTIPIQDLIRALPDVPDEVVNCVNALRYNSLTTIMLGIETDSPCPYTAVYLPDPAVPFHRISFPRNFSNESVPAGHDAILVEITTNPGDDYHDLNDEALIEVAVSGLEKMNFLTRESLRFHAVHRSHYAYVIRTFDYEQNLSTALNYLDGLGIISCGRNAQFAYINMDEAVKRGLDAVRQVDERMAEEELACAE